MLRMDEDARREHILEACLTAADAGPDMINDDKCRSSVKSSDGL